MKRNLLLIGSIAGMITLASCGSDDGPSINPIVGEWEIDEYELEVVDPAFNGVDGIRTSLYGETSYVIEFNQDGTFERELRSPVNRLEDDGEWEIDGDELELDIDGSGEGLVEDFEIISLDGEDLVMQAEINFILLPNTTVDTITTQASFDAVLAEFGETKTVEVTYNFEKD